MLFLFFCRFHCFFGFFLFLFSFPQSLNPIFWGNSYLPTYLPTSLPPPNPSTSSILPTLHLLCSPPSPNLENWVELH
jgi:hypothetical protein